MIKIFIPLDAGAVAVGADEVAAAFAAAATARQLEIEIVRTGSRGLYWLEPMVEFATPEGRVAFGPVTEDDVVSVLDAMKGEVATDQCIDPAHVSVGLLGASTGPHLGPNLMGAAFLLQR